MLQNVWITAVTVSELLRENQQGGGKLLPSHNNTHIQVRVNIDFFSVALGRLLFSIIQSFQLLGLNSMGRILSYLKVSKSIGESIDVAQQHTVYSFILSIQFKKCFCVFLSLGTGSGLYHRLKIYFRIFILQEHHMDSSVQQA